jgi:hypothetical protein
VRTQREKCRFLLSGPKQAPAPKAPPRSLAEGKAKAAGVAQATVVPEEDRRVTFAPETGMQKELAISPKENGTKGLEEFQKLITDIDTWTVDAKIARCKTRLPKRNVYLSPWADDFGKPHERRVQRGKMPSWPPRRRGLG